MKLRTITLATICTILTITLVTYAGTFTAQAGDLVLFHTRQLVFKPYAPYTSQGLLFKGAIHGVEPVPLSIIYYWNNQTAQYGQTFTFYGAILTPPSSNYTYTDIFSIVPLGYAETTWFRQEWWRRTENWEFMSLGIIGGQPCCGSPV
ncbi:MAG: hypothetical protein GXO26_01730, partial [Crenarchaeota archaeon]|nr:hypothetical protein [Thermoproteota archaeon]